MGLTPLTRSAALHFATLASLACSVHGLAHSLRSLPRGTVVIRGSVFILKLGSMGTNVIFVLTRNTPLEAFAVDNSWASLVELLLGDPHFLEGGERSQDGATDPDGVFPLGRS